MPLPADILRPHLSSVTYTPVKPLDVLALEIGIPECDLIKLDANENLYGPLPSVRAAMDGIDMHIYPDPSQHKLKQALSQLHACSPDSLVVGAGSDEVLELVIKVVQCKAVVSCSPTFGMYKFLSNVLDVPFVDVPRDSNFNVDSAAVIAKITELGRCIVYLASPNNPTGNCLARDDFLKICATDCVVVLDEAYAEFSGASLYEPECRRDNVIFCRTFSKWAALAGMRVGYCIAHSTFVTTMMAVKQPYNIPVCSEAAALAAVSARPEIMKQVMAIVDERNSMVAQLKQFPYLQAFPSQANFVLFHVTSFPAQNLALALRSRGILVRFFGQQGGNLAEFIRISSARACDTAGLIAALRDITAQVNSFRGLLDAHAYDTLIFDMDGVMVEVKGSYRAAIIATCQHFGVAVTNEDISAFKARGNANNDWDVSLNLIKESGVIDADSVPSRQAVVDVFEALYQGTATQKGLKCNEKALLDLAFFQRLKKKFKLAIVTGRPRKDCMEFLALHSLSSLFDSIVTMDDAPLKPSPEPIHLAMRLAGGSRGIMFGDTKDDIVSATSAGHVGVGVLPPGALAQAQMLKECGASAVFCAGMHELVMALHGTL